MADMAYGQAYAMNPVQARECLVQTYAETDSLRETARHWHTSRQVVRKWVRRFEQQGEERLHDRSRRPYHSPNETSPQLQQQVLQARAATNYGGERLALYLERHGVSLSPNTVRNILRRHGVTAHRRQRRKPLYAVHWAWDEGVPFALIQADVKDVLDKKALDTTLWAAHPQSTPAPL